MTADVGGGGRGRGWRVALSEALFVPEEGAGLRRRPADAIAVIAGTLLLLATAAHISSTSAIELTLAELLNRLPDGLAGSTGFLYRLSGLWFVVLVGAIAAIGGRRRLGEAVALAGIGAWLVGKTLIAIGGDRPPPASIVVRYGSAQYYPLVRVAVAVAVLCASAPYLTVLARRLGWAAAAFASVAAVYLGVGLPNDAAAGVLVGIVVGSAVKLALGSPAGRPTLEHVRRALDELDVAVVDLQFEESPDGVTALSGRDDAGAIVHVKAYGRDERDAQLLAKAWRFVWYSESGASLLLTRLQQVEHEAYVLLRAESVGAPVPALLAAATAGPGMAVLVDRRPRAVVASTHTAHAISDETVESMWRAVARLHESAHIAHGALDLDHFVVTSDGDVVIVDFGASITAASPRQLSADRARLLAATATAVGSERAVAVAARVCDDDQLAATIPFVQPPVLTDAVRGAARQQRGLLDDVRTRAAVAARTDVVPPAQLTRTSPRSVAIAAFTFLGAYLLLGQLASFRDLGHQLGDVQWSWITVAVVCAALTNVGFAAAFSGAAPVKVPYGSVVALQAAGSFTDLVTPNGIGTTGMNVRFLQLRGLPVSTALAASLVNAVASTAVNVVLLLAVLPASGAKVHVDLIPWRGVLAVALLVVVVATIVGAILWRLPRARRLYDDQVRPAIGAIGEVTRNPSKVALVLGGNLMVSLLYGLTLTATCRAFGDSTPFTTLLFLNIVISYVIGLIPVPGSVGVAEAGLSAGLTSVGVPATIAVAIALTHRLITGWLPPIPGWFALRYLEREGDL